MPWKVIKPVLSHITLFQWTLLYLITLSFIGSGIIIAFESSNGLRYVDAWFIASSAISGTGLISVDFARFSIGAQITVLILIQLGGVVFTTMFPVIVRRYQLRHKYIKPRKETVEGEEDEGADVEKGKTVPTQTEGAEAPQTSMYVVFLCILFTFC